MAIAAARSARVLATSRGPTVQAIVSQILYGSCSYDEEWVGGKVTVSNIDASQDIFC